MADITTPMQIATSTPQEAAVNIDNSDLFGIDPDQAKELKSQIQPEVDAAKKPVQATPKVAEYISQSGEHAALAQPDTGKLSWMESRFKYLSDQVGKIPSDDRKINDLAFKKMFNKDKFSENDELQLFQLNEDSKSRSDYGVGDFTDPNTPLVDKAIKGLGFLGQVSRGMVDSIVENKEIVAGGAATGAGIGAAGGAAVGGVGAIPGAIAGAGTGLVYGGLTALAYDGAVQQMGSTYNLLSNVTKDDGTPMNIDDDTKKYISIGVGSAVGAISLIGGRATAKTVPFISELLTKKGMTQVLGSAENQAFKLALTNIGKAGAVGFAEGGSQEYVRIIGEEVGKTYDGSKASFINGLISASTKLETLKRSTVSGALTATASTSFSAVGNVVGYAKNVKKLAKVVDNARDVTPAAPQQITGGDGTFTIQSDIAPIKPKGSGNGAVTPVDSSVDVLNFKETISEMAKVSGETEMKKIAPGQLFKLRQSMTKESGVETVYLDKEDLQNFATDEEKGTAVRNIIDSNGEAQAATNAPIQVDTHKFLELVDQYPNTAELAKLTPEGPTAKQAREHLENIDAAATKRQEILTKLGATDITPEDKATLQQALETEQPFRTYPSNEVFGEDEYLKQPTLIEAIDKVFAEGAGKKYKDAQLKARQSVAEGIAETAQLEMNQVVDIVAEEARIADYDAQMDRLENNPNLALVDRFTKTYEMVPDQRFDSAETARATHAKPGYSPLAIDPRLMTDEQKTMFAKNKQLRTHKVFVKGGMSPDDSARLLGVNNGDNLLKILSQTPSREDVAAYRTAQREADIVENAKQSVDLNKTAIATAYNDNTANHIAEMKFMKDKQWGDVKTGIKKIALPLPTKEGLRIRAESAIAKTTVGKLNANQFKVGERKSQRLSIDSILNNQVEKAFVNKEAAALNSELARATHIAIGKVNRVIRFARKLNSPENKAELKSAGFDKAANEILNVFHLTSKKSQVESGAFEKHVRQSLEQGEAVTIIPERLSDVRQSLGEMTVEQVIVVGDALKNMLHQAKMKNKLYEKHDNIRVLKTIEGLGNALDKQAKLNPEYNEKNLVTLQDTSMTKTEQVLKGTIELGTYLRRTQNLLVSLDNGKDLGLANDLFWQPIKQGNSKEIKMGIDVSKQLNTIIDKFGRKEFNELANEIVTVPEFKVISSLKNGRISKAELLKMNLNRGNNGNLEALERFGITRDVFKTVIERELGEHKYMELTQRIWDMHKSFEPNIAELQKQTQGTEVKFVQAEPVEFTDKNGDTRTYPGGYYPLQYMSDKVKNTAEKLIGTSDVNRADKFRQKFYAQAQTEQGHLESRTGNTAVLDLGLNGIGYGLAQTIHDLNMRIPIRDTAKLLSDKKIRETIVKTLGQEGYSAISDMVISQVKSMDIKTHSDAAGAIVNFNNYFMNNFSSAHLLLKLPTVLIQGASLPIVLDRIPGGAKHMAKVLAKLPGNFKEMVKFAEDNHPPLRDAREGFEGDISHKLNKIMPVKSWPKGTDWVRKGLEGITESGFHILQQVDNFNKVIAFHTAYDAAMNGAVDGVDIGNHADAVKYASNVTELTTTHSSDRNKSAIQKEKWIKPFLMFYNDANAIMNHIVDKTKQGKNSFKESYNEYQQGNYKQSSKAAKAGTATIMGTMLTLTMIKAYENAIRGKKILPFDEDDDAETMIKKSVASFAMAPAEQVVSGIPFLKDADYTLDFAKLTNKKQKLEPPPMKIGNTFIDSYTGLKAALDFSEDARALSKSEKKSFVYTAGYVFGVPSDAIYKYLLSPDWSELPATAKSELDVLNDRIEKFKKSLGVNLGDKANAEEIPPELMKQLEQTNIDTGEEVPPEMLQQLEQLQMEINPIAPDTRVTPETMDIIKKIESNGEWAAQNPNSSAAGLYQFTEGTWKDLMERHPELGLTENGRVSADTEQQDVAMEFFTNENIDRLERNGLEASIENVYAAHFLGGAGAVDVLSSEENSKLQDLVGRSVMRANGFRPAMKVKDFKRWLTRKTTRAIEAIQKQASIDNPTN